MVWENTAMNSVLIVCAPNSREAMHAAFPAFSDKRLLDAFCAQRAPIAAKVFPVAHIRLRIRIYTLVTPSKHTVTIRGLVKQQPYEILAVTMLARTSTNMAELLQLPGEPASRTLSGSWWIIPRIHFVMRKKLEPLVGTLLRW